MGAAILLIAAAQALSSGTWVGKPLAEVEHAARRGEKNAALELGKRYELGTGGAPCHAERALHWYGKAARTESGRRLAYSPPVGRERYGRFAPVGDDPIAPGLPLAGERLAALKARQERAGGRRRAPRCLFPGAEEFITGVSTVARSVRLRQTLAGCTLILLASCHSMTSNAVPASYTFVLKQGSETENGIRVRVDVPSAYVKLDRAPSDAAIKLAQFTFPFRFPDRQPVDPHALAGEGVVLATFAWAPPGTVKNRIDGSRVNHYSRYLVKRPDSYALRAAQGRDGIDTSVLYTSPDQSTLIECHSILNEPPRSCHLVSNPAPYLALELSFNAALLPQWASLMHAALSLVTIHTATAAPEPSHG